VNSKYACKVSINNLTGWLKYWQNSRRVTASEWQSRLSLDITNADKYYD